MATPPANDDPADESEGPSSNQCLCETFLYAAQDANFNVTNLFESDGDLAERYAYTPYGQRQVYKAVDEDDHFGTQAIPHTQPWTISSTDQPYGLCDVGHQGLLHDKEIGLIHNRARTLHPRLGRFLQRDPLGYVDGMSLYEYVGSGPITSVDPGGLFPGLSVLFEDSKLSRAVRAEARRWFEGNASDSGLLDRILQDQGEANELIKRGYEAADGAARAFDEALSSDLRELAYWADRWPDGVLLDKNCPINKTPRDTIEAIKNLGAPGPATYEAAAKQIQHDVSEALSTPERAGEGAYKVVRAIAIGKLLQKLSAIMRSVARTPMSKGLTTPKKYFGSKTKLQVEKALQKKFGPPKPGAEGGKSFYDLRTKRTFHIHKHPRHRGGKPHVDIRKRGVKGTKVYELLEE